MIKSSIVKSNFDFIVSGLNIEFNLILMNSQSVQWNQ